MNERPFEPGEAGLAIPAPQHPGGTAEKEKRRRAGTPATLGENIEQAFDGTEDTGKRQQWQAYIRWLNGRYGLSSAYVALVWAEFRWGGA